MFKQVIPTFEISLWFRGFFVFEPFINSSDLPQKSFPLVPQGIFLVLTFQ